jgi:hypothetical protein
MDRFEYYEEISGRLGSSGSVDCSHDFHAEDIGLDESGKTMSTVSDEWLLDFITGKIKVLEAMPMNLVLGSDYRVPDSESEAAAEFVSSQGDPWVADAYASGTSGWTGPKLPGPLPQPQLRALLLPHQRVHLSNDSNLGQPRGGNKIVDVKPSASTSERANRVSSTSMDVSFRTELPQQPAPRPPSLAMLLTAAVVDDRAAPRQIPALGPSSQRPSSATKHANRRTLNALHPLSPSPPAVATPAAMCLGPGRLAVGAQRAHASAGARLAELGASRSEGLLSAGAVGLGLYQVGSDGGIGAGAPAFMFNWADAETGVAAEPPASSVPGVRQIVASPGQAGGGSTLSRFLVWIMRHL